MASKKKQSTMDALVAYMKKHPKAVFADARDALGKNGHKIYPIMWGRAQVLLGRVKAKKRGAAKKKAAAATRAPAAKKAATRKKPGRKPGRRAASGASGGEIAIDAGDLERWQALVDHLNGGGKVALQYDGSGWILTTRG